MKNCIMNDSCMQTCKQEILNLSVDHPPQNMNDWIETLSYENLSCLHYTQMAINETLRLESATIFSTGLKFT